MYRFVTPLIACLLLLVACATAEEPSPEARPATAPESTDGGTTDSRPTETDAPVTAATDEPAPVALDVPDCDPELAAAFDAWAAAGFTGSIAVATGGEFDCLVGHGLADRSAEIPIAPDTVFSIGSITKAFTAAAIAQLADRGALDLDDTAGSWVPELTSPVAGATIRQLLVHTSGLTGTHGRDHEPLGREEAIASIDGLEVAFEPGTDYLYSNAGYTLLALVVEAASGIDYRSYMADEVLVLPTGTSFGGFWDGKPAADGPRAIGYAGDDVHDTGELGDFAGPHWALDGNGGLAMTPADLATWTRALFTGDLISPAASELVSTLGWDNGDGTGESPGWVVFDESQLGEAGYVAAGGGGGIGHDMVVGWFPGSDRVIVAASNDGPVASGELLQAITPALLAGDPIPTPPPAPELGEIDSTQLAALAGRYEIADTDVPVVIDGAEHDDGGDDGDVGADIGIDVDLPADGFEVVPTTNGIEVTALGPVAIATMFPAEDAEQAAGMADHEDLVRALLAGETAEGRSERELIEAEFGPIERVRILGTVWAGFEFQTYAEVTTGREPITGWYALDERGGVAGVELGTGPAISLVFTTEERFVPDDPTGAAPVTIVFNGETMTVTGPAGVTTASTS